MDAIVNATSRPPNRAATG